MLIEKINTVTGRIFLLIASSLFGTFILATVSLYQINQVFHAANTGNHIIVPSVISLDKAMASYGRLRTRIYRHIVSEDPAVKAEVDTKLQELIQHVQQAFSEYQALAQTPEDKERLDKELSAFADFLRETEPILTLSRQNQTEAAIKMVNGAAYKQLSETVYAQLTDHMDHNKNQAIQASLSAEKEEHNALIISAIIFVIIALGLTALGIAISRSLKKQLGGEPQTVVQITERIAYGDLSSTIILAAEDQNSILASMHKMQQQLKKLMAEIESMISEVAQGHFTYQMDLSNKQGFAFEIGQKLNQLNQTLLQQIGGNPLEGVQVASAIAAGNLDVKIPVREGDQSSIMYALSVMSLSLKTILHEVQEMVNHASAGNFSGQMDVTHRQGYALHLGTLLNTLNTTTQAALSDISQLAQTLAQGNLTKQITRHYPGIFGESVNAMNQTASHLRTLIYTLIESINLISAAAMQISAGNQDLSRRTEEQANSLAETAVNMEKLTEGVRQNNHNTTHANQLSQNASQVAAKGGVVVMDSVSTMSEITQSANHITEIISVIDSIAFQTNILSLNAAVEAARAGNAGRGFAVVANEVRSLSLRTKESAKKIKDLIDDSSIHVARGTAQVKKAGATMTDIVQSIDSVTHLIAEINEASNDQRNGIEYVNKAISQMDEVTQQNAALVEQVAAAAESLENQAQQLKQQVRHFKL